MTTTTQRTKRRSGAAVLETAFILILFVLFLFGLIEYCRIVFLQQVVENAAREGGRYAVVNGSDPQVVANTQAVVSQNMGNVNNWLQGYSVQVFAADNSGNKVGPATNIQYGQCIAVQITGNYNPILPKFLFLGQTISVSHTCLMYTEGN